MRGRNENLVIVYFRNIIGESKLDQNTVAAQKEEEERKQRLAERSQMFTDAPNLKSLLSG